jgi:hypothetical protein
VTLAIEGCASRRGISLLLSSASVSRGFESAARCPGRVQRRSEHKRDRLKRLTINARVPEGGRGSSEAGFGAMELLARFRALFAHR